MDVVCHQNCNFILANQVDKYTLPVGCLPCSENSDFSQKSSDKIIILSINVGSG